MSDVNIKHPFSERFIFNTKCQTEASFIALFFVELNGLKPSYADFYDGYVCWFCFVLLFLSGQVVT